MKGKLVKPQTINYSSLIAFFVTCILLLQSASVSTERNSVSSIRLMFYNVENLFDTIDSPKDDAEFLPGSDRRWNGYKYRMKLNNLAKVIAACSNNNLPEIVGLCEVENRAVMEDLVSRTILRSSGYKALYGESYDRRGIGVGILFSNRFDTLRTQNLFPLSESGDTMYTRSILFVELADKFDTLGIFVTHWPSRRGGVSLTDPLRRDVASFLYAQIKKIYPDDSRSNNIIIMGDMNCDIDSDIFSSILYVGDKNSSSRLLIRPSGNKSDNAPGSYKYQGRWNTFDQILIDRSFFENDYGYFYSEYSYSVLWNSNILVEDKTYHGFKPFSTWRGPVYQGGYSDHLPVMLDLILIEN